ncbi:MAG: carboxypeptidase-like regulatory domain-containing protein [Elusimicrobiales bacterium]|nr:carboxypeptidase-like regulatory domain-containing protein [Elusimicrobiales bacterium]
MRSFTKLALAAALAIFSSGGAIAATTSLTVHVADPDGGNLPGVKVAAIQWGMNGPSTYTLLGLTDASGNKVFNLEQQMGYSIYVTSHGYSPTVAEQFNDPEYNPNRSFWPSDGTPLTAEFTLTPGLTGVGKITQAFINATPNKVLMGGMYNMLAQLPGASGMVFTNGAGAGVLEMENVPFAQANTYNIGLYDPELNRGIGRNVMSDLGDGSAEYPGVPALNYPALDFNQSIPPSRVETNTQPGGSSAGSAAGVSVEGVIHELNYTTATVNHTGLGIKACVSGNNWSSWANTDENGRFQLYGLNPGTTYYFNVMGGCSWTQNGPGACYGPYSSAEYNSQDICLQNPASINTNDLLYVSSDVAYHSIKLVRMPRSNGQIRVYVRSSSGYTIPNANVNVNPDGTPWPLFANSCDTPNDFSKFTSNPGFSNASANTSATGYALLDGLPSGNYNVNVWTPFSNSSSANGPTGFNAGPDGIFGNWNAPQWQAMHCNTPGGDDYRVTIDTTAVPTMKIYDSSGTLLNLSSITYIVDAGAANTSGEVRGVLRFPSAADLLSAPIMITLYPQCMEGPCGSGNFAVIDGSGSASYPYTIHVASGTDYWMNINSPGWGRLQNNGNNMITLQSTGTVVLNMDFAPAGTVSGTLYKPDGTIFTPAANQYIHVGMNSDRGGSGTQLQSDGSFELKDVLSGEVRAYVSAGGMGEFNYALPTPAPTVTVTAGSTVTLNIKLVNAVYVGVQLSTAMVPDPSIIASDYDALIGFRAIPVPAGTVLKGETLKEMLFGKGDNDNRLTFANPTGMMDGGPCGNSWPGGFCAKSVPSPAVYDFYLMRSGDFGDMSSSTAAAVAAYPHFTLLTSSKNVIVDSDHIVASSVRPGMNGGTLADGIPVNLTPATDLSGRGNAVLAGNVSADNFFRETDYVALNGELDDFMEYLPLVTLYGSDGGFKAAGIVVPPPAFIQQHDQDFNIAYAQGYQTFKALLDLAGTFGFEIRGLAPSTCFTAVVTTPNYPPYQTRACTGVNNSTTTITVDLDSAVGAGATVQGVVTSTAGVLLPNASVELLSEGSDARTAVTNSSGAYSFLGLAPGNVKIRASIDGYASGETEEDLTGSNTYTKNLALTAAGGSLTGTVYSQKLPYAKVQAGAQIVAYNDTYNGTHPDSPLPLIRTKTGADGSYTISGLIPGDVYKVFLKVPGKYTLSVSTPAAAGVVSGVDFTMLPKPLDIEVFAKKTETDFEFTVLNPQDFKSGWVGWSASPFDGASASTVTLTQLSSGEMNGKIPLSALTSGVTYVLQGVAKSYSGRQVIREILFGSDYKGNAKQQIDDAILGDDTDDGFGRKNNEVPMDRSGDDPSGIMFPPGAVQASTGSVPTCSFKGEDKDSSAVAAKVAALGADAFAGDLYTVELASVTHNENKSIEITLAYDKSTANLDDLSVARYNDGTGKWEQLSGVATVNPLKGTVKVKLRTLASVLSVRPGRYQANRFDGKQYRVSAVGSSTSGTFAVVRPSIAGNAYAGSKLKVFNYPNPFNLKSKTVNNSQGAALSGTTEGTVIHVEVPAGNGGEGHVRIYTLAGELVNDLRTNFTAGAHNYVLWAGNNKAGQPVANGVYYGVVELAGKSPDREDATFKMVVVK